MQQAFCFAQDAAICAQSCNQSSYSAFIPNEACEELTPSQCMVYATVQFLSFFSQKITPATINKRLIGMSRGTIRNALLFLKKRAYLVFDKDGVLFKNHKKDRAKDYLTARELPAIHKGYWLSLSLLSSHRLKPIDKITFGVIMSLIKYKEKKIDISYIAQKINVTVKLTSKSIASLVENAWIKRSRKDTCSPFTYQIGEHFMSQKRPQQPYSISDNITSQRDINTQCHEIDTPKCHEIDVHSNNIDNINNKYRSNLEDAESIPYVPGKNNSLFFLKTLVDYVDGFVEKLQREKQRAEVAVQQFDDEYLAACNAGDLKKMVDMRTNGDMGMRQLKLDAAKRSLENATEITTNHLRAIGGHIFADMTNSDIQQIGKGVKAILPDFESPTTKKKAFCVLMNSVLYDLKLEYQQVLVKTDWRMKSRERVAMQQAINRCLRRAANSRYRINDKVALGYYDKVKDVEMVKSDWVN